ncbi:NAD(+) salvage pathway protein [Rhizina undulata]
MAAISQISAPVPEVDPDFDGDYDSAYSDYCSGVESDTTSLISTAMNHVYENGRRYQGYKQGIMVMPNDEAEQDRLDLNHHCCLLALRGELYACPVTKESSPQRILDVGTGTGIWAMDIADQFPSAQVIGVDLSPIQPTWVPPNLKFEVDDVEEDWPYQNNSFDFIHIRSMAGHICDWPKFYRQAFKALKPGGWIELQDPGNGIYVDDKSLPQDHILTKWVEFCVMVSEISGRPFHTVAPGHAKALEDVGCVDVTDIILKLPIGRWPKAHHEKELGMYWRQNLIDSADGSLIHIMRVLGRDAEEIERYKVDAQAALCNRNHHMYTKLYVAYGRKPKN